MSTEKIMERIRKLLALSSSPNEKEAASALEKAHVLLREYNLELADVKEPTEESSVESTVYEEKHDTRWKGYLLHQICRSTYCAMVLMSMGRGVRYEIYGRPANVATALALYEYLAKAIARISNSARDILPNYDATAFRYGMIDRLSERLEEQRYAQEHVTESRALVVVSQEAQDALRKAHPNLTKRRTRVDFTGSSAAFGRQMADSVSLNKQVGGATERTGLIQ